MEWTPDWNLRGRMIVAVALLLVFGIVFAGVVLAVLAGIAISFGWPVVLAPVVTALLFVGILIGDLVGENRVVREADAYEADAEKLPRAHRIAGQVAQQADLPMPTIAVAARDSPEAFTVGYRPSTTTLVVSTGLLKLLDDDELRAVFAHEFAHVKNRDAAVMTAASLPTAVAHSLREWAGGDDGTVQNGRYRRSSSSSRNNALGMLLAAIVAAVAGLFELIGRVLIATFSRSRELAADRGAVAITGDAASLVSALENVADELVERPSVDLRKRTSVSAFSVVAPTSVSEEEPIMLGPDGDQEATYYNRSQHLTRRFAPFVRTHPPVSARRDQLMELQRQLGS